jgi:glutamate dehydrogenase/leucine dehydrogenase
MSGTASPGFGGGASRDEVWKRYGAYLRRPPLLSLEWNDDRTAARGWLVINSLRGGAAGGGTRMRSGLIRREVVYLAKTMELKFVFSGPPIGGAKSGIDFDPADPRRGDVLRRWFRAILPQLKSCYGTGGDLNVDEVLDVIPCFAELGLSHPQEGVVRGHLRPEAGRDARIFASLDAGVKAPVSGPDGLAASDAPLADLITGYGLARSIIHHQEVRGLPVSGLRVALEGFGAVGGPCALYLARAGARVTAIADNRSVLLAPDGLAPLEVEELLGRREGKCLPQGDPRLVARHGAEVSEAAADLFVAAAVSGTIDARRLESLRHAGVRMIACGANQPFREAKLGATRVQRLADQYFTVIPDVVANCGMARAFSFLMENPSDPDPASVFAAVDETIAGALAEIADRNGREPTGLLAATLAYALDRVDTAGDSTSPALQRTPERTAK